GEERQSWVTRPPSRPNRNDEVHMAKKTRRRRESQEQLARRSMQAHMEHIRAVGQALMKAVDRFAAEEKISDAEGDWEADLGRNITEARREFHRVLTESSRKVNEIYFAEEEEEEVEDEEEESSTTAKPKTPRQPSTGS